MAIVGPTTNHEEIRSWANRHGVVPTEVLPCRVDHEPSLLRLMDAEAARTRKDLHILSWQEFFARFDVLGLAFVYDEDKDSYNELLQRDEKAPHMGHAYRAERFLH